MSSIKLYEDVDEDVDNAQTIKFFNLDQRLLNALKEDNIEKYLIIVKEKQMEEYKLKEQKKEDELRLIQEAEQKKKDEFIQAIVKKEEELFEENKIEIHKRIQEKIQQRMMSEIKYMMIYKLNDSILKLENKIRDALTITENNIQKNRNKIEDLYNEDYVNNKYKFLKN
jgi:hypothetical protein